MVVFSILIQNFRPPFIRNIRRHLLYRMQRKKIRKYCLDPDLPIVPVRSSRQDSLFSLEQIYCYIGSVKKKH
jgi:hypothetical protein